MCSRERATMNSILGRLDWGQELRQSRANWRYLPPILLLGWGDITIHACFRTLVTASAHRVWFKLLLSSQVQ